MISCNVAVTGLNAMDDSLPGIPVIRSLRASTEWTGKIIGLTYDAFDTGIFNTELLDEVYLMPYPTEGECPLSKAKANTAKDIYRGNNTHGGL